MNPHHITHHVHPDPTDPHTLLHRATCTCGKEIIGTSSHHFTHAVTEEMDHKIRQHLPTPPDLRDHHTTVEYLPWNDEYMADCLCGWVHVVDTFAQAQDANAAHIAELGDRIAQTWQAEFKGKDVRETIRAATPPARLTAHHHRPGDTKPITIWK